MKRSIAIFLSFLLVWLGLSSDGNALALSPVLPPLWGNSDFGTDRSRNWIFADTIRQIRNFGTPTPRVGQAKLASDGYPTEDFGGVIMTGQKKGSIAGVYKGSLTLRNASPTVQVNLVATSGKTQNVVIKDKTVTFEFNIDANADQLMFQVLNTNGGVSNIKILRPWYTSSDTFTREYLTHVNMFWVIRFMDLTYTNGSNVSKWSERTLPSEPKQTADRWIAWEYAIELANTSQKDIWINIPHQADDDYVKNLALLLKQKLNPNLKVYVEYSNEVWNGLFSQNWWNHQQAITDVKNGVKLNYDGSTNDRYWAWRRTGERIKQISDIFKGVYGSGSINTQIRPVLATQWAYWEVTKQALSYLSSQYGNVNAFLYGVAIAPYIGLGEIPTPKTKEDIYNFIKTTTLPQFSTMVNDNAKIAKKYQLKLLAYEWGFDNYGTKTDNVLVKQYFDSDLVRQNLQDYFNIWRDLSNGGLFMWYFFWASNREGGYIYGTTDVLTTTNTPHIQAIKAYTSTSFTPLSDADWYTAGIYTAPAPSTPLVLNYDLSWTISQTYYALPTSKTGSITLPTFNYRIGEYPFIDLMKTATAFSFWRGSDDTAKMELDADGWPRSMKDTSTSKDAPLIRTILLSQVKTLSGQNLVVYYQGQWDFQMFWWKEITSLSGSGRKVFSVDSNSSNVSLEITATDTKNYLRNIHIVRQDQEELFKKGVIFKPQWIDTLKSKKQINFNTWIASNLQNASDWTKRGNLNAPTYTKQVPYEVMIALLNATKSDGVMDFWSSIPQNYFDGVKALLTPLRTPLVTLSLYYKAVLTELKSGSVPSLVLTPYAKVSFYKKVWLLKDQLDSQPLTVSQRADKIETLKTNLKTLLAQKPTYTNLINYYITLLDELKLVYITSSSEDLQPLNEILNLSY